MSDHSHVQQPPGVHPSVGYSHAVSGAGRLVFLSGQVPVDEAGALVGRNDPAAQCEQVFRNLAGVLAAAGTDLSHVVKLTYYLTDMDDLRFVASARDRHMAIDHPAASTVVEVRALYRPDVVVEVEAVAIC
jgi:enamine deaminase RidA (YjgF/YER057c/UK114 family)